MMIFSNMGLLPATCHVSTMVISNLTPPALPNYFGTEPAEKFSTGMWKKQHKYLI